MGDRFSIEVARGAVRTVRRHEVEAEVAKRMSPGARGGGSNAGLSGKSTAGRVVQGFSAQSRRRMRWEFASVPLNLMGEWPAMMTLTYPRDWRAVCPDWDTLDRHREAWKERWRYRYGAPIGFWAHEFQPRVRQAAEFRQAPHIHLYLGLPAIVEESGEYWKLVERTKARLKSERSLRDKYEARRRTPRVETCGEFATWLARSWAEVVGVDRLMVDIRPVRWNREVTMNPAWAGEYLYRESAKWTQKKPPEGFGGGRWWGRWGQGQGFKPMTSVGDLGLYVFVEYRRMQLALARKQMAAMAARFGKKARGWRGPRGLDGMTLYVRDGVAFDERAREWAERLAGWKDEDRQERLARKREGAEERYWRACSRSVGLGALGAPA